MFSRRASPFDTLVLRLFLNTSLTHHFWERPILLGANACGKIEDLVTHF
jgi:hypothetical protein